MKLLKTKLQLNKLFPAFDRLQDIYGDCSLNSIYGAGCTDKPDLFLIFMNPTAKNITSHKNWTGIRAPWLGTKNIWKLFMNLDLINYEVYRLIQSLKPSEWTSDFCSTLYGQLSKKKIYITNLAKCTQSNARHLKDGVFLKYFDLLREEIDFIRPKNIISFGNQVSSIVLSRNIKISDYDGQNEDLIIKNISYPVFPIFYPVGQGMRNMDKSVRIIKKIL
jgi:DNA polymerase